MVKFNTSLLTLCIVPLSFISLKRKKSFIYKDTYYYKYYEESKNKVFNSLVPFSAPMFLIGVSKETIGKQSMAKMTMKVNRQQSNRIEKRRRVMERAIVRWRL